MLRPWLRLAVAVSLAVVQCKCDASMPLPCWDDSSCQALLEGISTGLTSASESMRTKRKTLQGLEQLRRGISRGKRVELLPSTREYLNNGSALVGEVTWNARHPPVVANSSQILKHVRQIGVDIDVRLHAFLPLKRPPAGVKGGPVALVVVIDSSNKMWLLTLDGHVLQEQVDLGHQEGSAIEKLAVTPSQEIKFIVTADSRGDMRVHNLRLKARREKPDDLPEGPELPSDLRHAQEKKYGAMHKISVTMDLGSVFSLSSPALKVSDIVAVERGTEIYLAAGDTEGGISLFHKNGTFVTRVVVTEDVGGISGLLRAPNQQVLFWSSHHFGFFSALAMDLESPPCSGWTSPIFHAAVDHTDPRGNVLLALTDGDLLAVGTHSASEAKGCEVVMKFPKVSTMPFELNVLRGHAMGLTTPRTETAKNEGGHLRELVFFNLAAYSTSTPARAVNMQVDFYPLQPMDLQIYIRQTAGSERSKVQLAVRMHGRMGLDVYDLSIKAPKASGARQTADLLEQAPQVAILAAGFILIVAWNAHQLWSQQQQEDRRKAAAAAAKAKAEAEKKEADEKAAKDKEEAEKREAAEKAARDGQGAGNQETAAREQGSDDDDEEPKIEEVFSDDSA